jgi:GntR family transcriptional regulator
VSHSFFNPYPKYLQIREILLRRLARDFGKGDRLPTEHALCAEFSVSRETVREALRGLEEDGLICRRRGQGTFVTRLPPANKEGRLTGLVEDFSELKFDTSARVLEAAPVVPPAAVVDMMKWPPGEMAFRIGRIRYLEGEPFAYHEAFLPLDVGSRVAKLDLSNTSILHELRVTLGLDIWEDHQRVEAVAADADMADALSTRLGAPLLYLVRHWLSRERSIVVFCSHFRADRYYYTVKLAQRPETGDDAPATKRRSGAARKGQAAPSLHAARARRATPT